MCKSAAIWGRAGATMAEATGEMKVKEETTKVAIHLRLRGQFLGFSGSEAPVQETMLGSRRERVDLLVGWRLRVARFSMAAVSPARSSALLGGSATGSELMLSTSSWALSSSSSFSFSAEDVCWRSSSSGKVRDGKFAGVCGERCSLS